MPIFRLIAQRFRHFQDLDLDLDSRFQVISGQNGAGKTSILEAIYFSAYAKSFRSHQLKHCIYHDEESFDIHAEISDTQDGTRRILKAHYDVKQRTQLLLDQIKPKRNTDLAFMLPCVVLDTNTHRLLSSMPKWRRDFINYCAFYSSADYGRNLARYQKILSQRNALLKQFPRVEASQLHAWDEPLSHYAERVTQDRIVACEHLNNVLPELIHTFLQSNNTVRLRYHSALGKYATMEQALQASRTQDLHSGYTHYGPHRADILIELEHGGCVFDTFSQGQLKRLACALTLAKIKLLKRSVDATPILLLDDLCAELDTTGQDAILQHIQDENLQSILTTIDFDWKKRFPECSVYELAPL